MSPGVTASCETRKATFTVLVCPGASVTRVNPTSRWFGTTTALTGWWTYTGTTSVPATLPVLDTMNLAGTVPLRDRLAGDDSPVTLEGRVGEGVKGVGATALAEVGAGQLVEELRLIAER